MKTNRKRKREEAMKVGIIGCGRIAQTRHIPEYAEHPGAQIVGYYDFNEERAKELAAVHGGRYMIPQMPCWRTGELMR